ncbi:GntR family transcriptional regulator [Pseudomonas tolaasii]|uniref:GntR family transcriptional regulator n=1 Tax=Pseudomonas tolaasii TaxID=29442 RepID=UPI001C5E14B1|nr:GntR family transcriptional regulator [Pseudomonas tolaasii]MBW4793252.1 GntR family transcriptional regulator [Pseudomonas tolaasii]
MRYTELANILTKQITDGEFSIGEQLPSEITLSLKYHVSRSTVRAALNIVQDLGLVTRKRRAGTIVSAQIPSNQYSKSLHSIEDLVNYAAHTERKVLDAATVVADDGMAAAMECRLGTKWLRIRMLRTEISSREPLCWNEAYLEHTIGERVVDVISDGTGLLCHIIRDEVGVAVADIKQTIGAVRVEGEVARQLCMPDGAPGLQITRSYVDDGGRTYLITVNTYAADKFRFSFWIHRADRS